MVAYDVGQLGEMNRRIREVVWRSAAVGFVLSLIGGVVISRSAAQRAEQLARTTEGVMAGDLTRRAPVFGSGDEFDRLSEQLNAMLAKLERLVISSRSAGDSIAHDLRSPLTRLRNRLEAGPEGDATKDGARAALVRLDRRCRQPARDIQRRAAPLARAGRGDGVVPAHRCDGHGR